VNERQSYAYLEDQNLDMQGMSALESLELLSNHARQKFCTAKAFDDDDVGTTMHRNVKSIYLRSMGFYARKHLDKKEVRLVVSVLPTESTKSGLYKDVIRLDSSSSADVRQVPEAISAENGRARVR
jgi:hypothetical protein